MKKISKIFLFLFSVILIVSINSTSNAAANTKVNSIISNTTVNITESEINSYVDEVITGYLKINELSTDVSLSNEIPILDLDTNTIDKLVFLVINNNDIVIAKLTVQELITGEFTSSFDMDSLDTYNKLYTQKNTFILACSKGRTIIFGEDSYEIIKDIDNVGDLLINYTIPSDMYNVIAKDTNITQTINNTYSVSLLTTSASKILNVPYRANTTLDGNGVCWAATDAAIIDYLLGTTRSTSSVFYQVKTDIGYIPTGTSTQAILGLTLNSVSGSYQSTLSYDSVISVLNTNKPIYMHLKKATTPSHAVVLKGATFTGGSSYFYMLMDPNVTNTVSVAISSSALSDGSLFTYVTSSDTYTWDYSIY